MPDTVRAFAPASIGNVAVGFDMLGLAIEGAGDSVTVRRTDRPGVTIDAVYAPDGEIHRVLSMDPARNTASLAAISFWEANADEGGLALSVHKGVPLQSGMGSSAASAVAAVVAANGLLDVPLPMDELLLHALEGERFASGGLHADNVAPSLLGGLVFCPPHLLPQTVSLPVPATVSAVLLHPDLEVNTAQSRQGLEKSVPMARWLEQQACMAGFIAACASGDLELLGNSLRDVIVEPQRKGAVSCFDAVANAARDAGALGCSLSGSGPSIFALTETALARKVARAMQAACLGAGIDCQVWTSPMTAPGARIEV
jgi:homoserine kinase